MKTLKSSLFVFALISVSLFTSCKEDSKDEPTPEPTPTPEVNVGTFSSISVNGTAVAADASTSVSAGTFTLAWSIAKGDNDIKSIKIERDNAVVTDNSAVVWDGVSVGSQTSNTSTWTNTITLNATAGTYKITLTDANNNTKTYSFTVSVTGTALVSSDFTMNGGTSYPITATLTFLSNMGLQWGGYYSNNVIRFNVMTITNQVMVALTTNEWTTISTKESLKTRIDLLNGTPANRIYDYSLPSASTSNTYTDKVIGIQYGTSYFMMKFNNSTVSPNLLYPDSIVISCTLKQ